MRKLLLILCLLIPVAANAASFTTALSASASDCTVTGAQITIGTTDATGSIQLSGTFVGTVSFKASANNGGSWAAINGIPWSSTPTAVTSSTGTGGWTFDVSGKSNLCAYISSYTSGTAVVSLNSGPALANNVISSAARTTINSYTSTAGSPYTWTKPAGAIFVYIRAIGGGGAGGAGIASTAAGGGGGGGGACADGFFRADDLAATLTVTIGAAGVGGATKSAATASTVADATNTLVSAGFGVIGIDASSNSGGGGGGGGGVGTLVVEVNSSPGTQANGGEGAGGGTGATTGGIGGKANTGGAGGGGGKNATGGGAGGTSQCGGGGGGGGASTGTAGAGGVGGQGAAGGASQGGSATTTSNYTLGGSGGAGGAQTTQTGGVGAAPGGGGGGGGNAANSGGNGAAGSVIVTTYY